MFTGIIEEIGRIQRIRMGKDCAILTIQAGKVLEGTQIGDSIAVNGICLTVTRMDSSTFDADVMSETFRRTNLAHLTGGSRVNLERALTLNSRLGGHIVSGHIDGTGTIVSMEQENNAIWVKISTAGNILRYIVEKGSVAIDGISLTVAALTDTDFSVSVIPHTGQETILLDKKSGDDVNLECDVIGKYVERLLMPGKAADNGNRAPADGRISLAMLEQNGFL